MDNKHSPDGYPNKKRKFTDNDEDSSMSFSSDDALDHGLHGSRDTHHGDSKKKRMRRTANEIERNWKCDLCNKSYGTEGALKTHTKLKHPGSKVSKGGLENASSDKFTTIHTAPYELTGYTEGTQPHFGNIPTSKSGYAYPFVGNANAPFYPPHKQEVKIATPPFLAYPKGGKPPPHGFLATPSGHAVMGFTPTVPLPATQSSSVKLLDQSHELRDQLNQLTEQSLIPILLLRIGSFCKTSVFVGDLSACFNLKDRRIAWEFLSLTAILRIPFETITGMGMETTQDGTTLLFIRLERPPATKVGWLSPHTAIEWCDTQDFTGGQASVRRHHILHFTSGTIRDPIEKLLEHEPRLRELMVKGLQEDDDLYFEKTPIPAPVPGSFPAPPVVNNPTTHQKLPFPLQVNNGNF